MMVIFPLYFITDSRYTNEVSVYKLYLFVALSAIAARCQLSRRENPLAAGFCVCQNAKRDGPMRNKGDTSYF